MAKHTEIDNSIVLNKNLSLEAKGLYAIIKHFSTIPGFEIRRSYILQISGYGEKSFRRVWKELKDFGLLVESKTRQGSKWIYKFTLGTLKQIKDTVINTVKNIADKVIKPTHDNIKNIEGKTGLNLTKWQKYISTKMDNAFLLQAINKFTNAKGKKFTFLIDCYLDVLAKNEIDITLDMLKMFKKENDMAPIIFSNNLENYYDDIATDGGYEFVEDTNYFCR